MMLATALALLAAEPDAFTTEIRKLLPTPGTLIFAPGAKNLTASGSAEFVASTTDGTLRVEVKKPVKDPWGTQVTSPNTDGELKKGDRLFVALEVRSLAGGRETGEAVIQMHCQQPVAPWENFGFIGASIGREWRRIFFTTLLPRDIAPGGLGFSVHIGQQPQTLEFRHFTALNLGQGVAEAKLPFNRVTYPGQERSAPWRKKAAEMIEQNRKAPLVLTVSRNGRPVNGAKVQVKLVRHEYPFATFLDHDPTGTDPDAAKYRELVPKLFNQVTVPIYWADWGWESETTRAGYFNRFAWARQQGLPMKAHNLVWPSFRWSPTRLQKFKEDPKALRSTILGEAAERAKALKDQPFVNVDVLNELKTETEFAQITGQDLYKELFDLARKTWPKADLVYNDFDVFEGGGLGIATRDEHRRIVRQLLADRVPVTMLGFQGHFGESLTPPAVVWQILDQYQKEFGLPIELTEFDVDTRDELTQADYTRDLLTAWFAHPSTTGFTMWGFHETHHWKPNGAMFRKDWSAKPNLAQWTELTQKVWTTNLTSTTDRQGKTTLRGFRGDYEVEVTVNGKTTKHKIVLTGKGGSQTIRLN